MREVDWLTSPGQVPYPAAVAAMDDRVDAIRRNAADDLVWCLEHPPLYTAGTSASDADLIDPHGLPLYRSGRGGQITYHGPGQRVVYLMLDLRRLPGTSGPDVRAYVRRLEAWLIRTLAGLGVSGERREGRVGIWVPTPGGDEAKVAAIGVRIRHWIAFHGIALNVDPDLGHYAGIVPCGIRDRGVTSLAALGLTADMARVDALLRDTFAETFGLRPCPRTADVR